jgi:hypothetical protein
MFIPLAFSLFVWFKNSTRLHRSQHCQNFKSDIYHIYVYKFHIFISLDTSKFLILIHIPHTFFISYSFHFSSVIFQFWALSFWHNINLCSSTNGSLIVLCEQTVSCLNAAIFWVMALYSPYVNHHF